MLSEIGLILLAIFTPIYGVFCFRYGFKCGFTPDRAIEDKIIPKRKRKLSKAEKAKLDREQAKIENINAYNGDSQGQKEIK